MPVIVSEAKKTSRETVVVTLEFMLPASMQTIPAEYFAINLSWPSEPFLVGLSEAERSQKGRPEAKP